jgi:hypothetical protein
MLGDDMTNSVVNQWFELPDRQRFWTKVGRACGKISVQASFVAYSFIFLKVALGRSESADIILHEPICAYQAAEVLAYFAVPLMFWCKDLCLICGLMWSEKVR